MNNFDVYAGVSAFALSAFIVAVIVYNHETIVRKLEKVAAKLEKAIREEERRRDEDEK